MTLKEIRKNIKISSGNMKTGNIDNISLPPIISCNKNAKCTKECYALKAYRLYPSAKQAWNKNFDTFKKDPKLYFNLIDKYLKIKKPSFFRWHVSGDIPSKKYLNGMILIAEKNPDIKFLAFTKQYKFNTFFKYLPNNLTIVISAWPGMRLPSTTLPIAYMQDGTEKRVKNAIECPGNCEKCGMCWNLKKLNKNVVFKKH